jgi:hypothetical protein
MGINAKPLKTTDAKTEALDKFVSGAPDAGKPVAAPVPKRPKGQGRPKTLQKKEAHEYVQISLTILQGDLDKIDDAAARQRIARSAFIRQAVFKQIEGD